ncbi:MAG: hypothetical protein O2840_03245 [bacterium]|nr:hypothetical protein [bacterium]
MNRRDDGDQSRFAAEEPLFESTQRVQPDVATVELTETELAAKKKKKVLGYAGLTFGAAILLLLVVSSLLPKSAAPATPDPDPVVSPSLDKTELQQRIESIRSDLRQADPSKQPLLFPPLNYKLGITTNE